MIEKIVSFTGHRPQKLPFKLSEQHPDCLRLKGRLREEIVRLITEQGATHFISGMALGVDQWGAEIVLELKSVYPYISLECALPCSSQSAPWTQKQRTRYEDILWRCDQETLLQSAYSADCMQKRNLYMIEQCDFLLAVWNGSASGTGKTVRAAVDCGKTVICINPNAH